MSMADFTAKPYILYHVTLAIDWSNYFIAYFM